MVGVSVPAQPAEMCVSAQDALSRLGRVSFPLSLFAYPFYLMNRSPGKSGSHFDPKCDLFTPAEGKLVSCFDCGRPVCVQQA